MGLEEIHQLTASHDVSLYIDVETFVGEPFTLKLETFSVGDAARNYTWDFSGYSHTSDRVKREVLTGYDNYNQFSTRDRDNDRMSNKDCAGEYCRGGWWYGGCTYINPNVNYEGDVTPTNTGINVWYIDDSRGSTQYSKAVKSIEMIIRTRVE